MGFISAAVFRRLFLLYVVGQFEDGVFGAKRLQKITYLADRNERKHVFDYKRWLFGQFSDTVEDIKDQLLSMQYLAAFPLSRDNVDVIPLHTTEDGGTILLYEGGNGFKVNNPSLRQYYRQTLEGAASDTANNIKKTIGDYGYMKEKELVEFCYALPEFQETAQGNVIWESTIPELVEVGLSQDECDKLEIALTPEIILGVSILSEAIQRRPVPWGEIREKDAPVRTTSS